MAVRSRSAALAGDAGEQMEQEPLVLDLVGIVDRGRAVDREAAPWVGLVPDLGCGQDRGTAALRPDPQEVGLARGPGPHDQEGGRGPVRPAQHGVQCLTVAVGRQEVLEAGTRGMGQIEGQLAGSGAAAQAPRLASALRTHATRI